MEPRMIVIDDERLTVESLERWRDHLVEVARQQCTEGGKHPHRASSTGHAMECDAISRIIDLAQQAVRIKSSHGAWGKAVAAEYLRQIATRLDAPTAEPSQGE